MINEMMKKDIKKLLRPNIAALTPYSTARDEFQGSAEVYLDANESAYDNGFNRYPDPRQKVLKKAIAQAENIKEECLFLGNGSDEAIDVLLRVFCNPGVDNVVSISPSYGMYEVAAATNDVELRKVRLREDFSLDAKALLAAVDEKTKIVFLCSPNNPSGNLLNEEDILRIAQAMDGIVVVDEAYIHYSDHPGFADRIESQNNIVVLRTLSKARAMAGLRVGMAIADPEIVEVMSMVKYPYNLSQATINEALRHLDTPSLTRTKEEISTTIKERARMAESLPELACVKKVYPSDANFLLVKVDNADALYDYLASKGIIVRNRNRVPGCEGTLRITIGRPEENNRVLEEIRNYAGEVLND